jgi:hypothetical protein
MIRVGIKPELLIWGCVFSIGPGSGLMASAEPLFRDASQEPLLDNDVSISPAVLRKHHYNRIDVLNTE